MIEVRSVKRVPGMNSGNSLRTNVPATVNCTVRRAVESIAVAVSPTTVEPAAAVLGSLNGRRTDS